MFKFKFKISSESNIIDKQGVIEQDGFNSSLLVPFSNNNNKGNFQEKFDAAYQIKSNSIVQQLDTINQEANNIKNQVLGLSTNLEENYLSEANLYDNQQLLTLASAIKENTATFVTTEQAGQWYGLELVTDVNGKKYVTGFDAGAIVHPETGNSDSYFRINADRFIVGGDLGDGSFTSRVDENGEPIPAFSIVQSDDGIPEMYFNGKVNISAIPEALNKWIGDFASREALDLYLSLNPNIIVNDGDTYVDTNSGVLYTFTNGIWVSNTPEVKNNVSVYIRSNTQPATPVGGNYESNTPAGWSDKIPAASYTSGMATLPVWTSSCVFSNKTDYVATPAVWSSPVLMVDSPDIDYMYNSLATTPITPINATDSLDVIAEDYINGWRNTSDVNSVWIASRRKRGGAWTAWEIIRVKGEPGNGAKTIEISPSSNIISYAPSGTLLTSNVTISTYTYGTSGVLYYEFRVNGVTVQNSMSASYTYTPALVYAEASVKIEVFLREGTTSGTIVASDVVTIARLKSGSDTVSALLSNESHSMAASSNGTVQSYEGTSTELYVYQGTSLLQYEAGIGFPSSVGRYRIVLSNYNVNRNNTIIDGYNAGLQTLTAFTGNNGSTTISISILTLDGKQVSLTKVQSFSKSLGGAAGTTGSRGSLLVTSSGASDIPPVATLNSAIIATPGSGGIVVSGDSVIWTNTLSTGITDIYNFNGTTWSKNNALKLSGDQIVNGTIFANKIGTYNLTSANTTIGTALIDNAHIKDLTVDTLKIKNGAVSSIVSTTGYGVLGSVEHNSIANARDIASLSYAYTGTGSISILVDFYGLNIGASTCEIMFLLERNGTQIFFPYGSEAFRLYTTYSTSYSFNLIDTPSAVGIYTYTLKMYVISSSATIKRASIIAIGIKK